MFALLHLAPGDPVDAIFAGENVTAEQKAEYRHQLGLDRSPLAQYASFAAKAARGDLGSSISQGVPVGSLIAQTLPATVELTLAALLVAIVIAVPVAIVSGAASGQRMGPGGSLVALFGISMPSFWLGIMLILLFAVTLNVFPSSGRLDIDTGLRPLTGLASVDALLQGNWVALRSALGTWRCRRSPWAPRSPRRWPACCARACSTSRGRTTSRRCGRAACRPGG